MSPTMLKLGLLSLVSSALAVPVYPTALSSPYGMGNSTGIHGPSGTARGTGSRGRHHHHSSRLRTGSPRTSTASSTVDAAAGGQTTTCTASDTVYSTFTNVITVTVTPSPAASEAAPTEDSTSEAAPSETASSEVASSEAAPTEASPTDAAPTDVAPTEAAPTDAAPTDAAPSEALTSEAASSDVVDAAALTYDAVNHRQSRSSAVPSSSSPAVVASSAPAPADSAPAIVTSAPAAYSSAAASSVVPSSTVATPSPYASPASSTTDSSKKRGLAYNKASLLDCFEPSTKISWAYNWASTSDGLDNSNWEFVPMLWGTADNFVNPWVDNAKKAIAAGASHILGFNEPDHPDQANINTDTAAAAYKKQITEKFGGGSVRLGSPAVTNGDVRADGGIMGLRYLTEFMSKCANCEIDFVVIHWYDSAANTQYFINHVTEVHEKTGLPVWITEFGATGTDEQISSFLNTVMTWMDKQDWIERYSYHMASDGILLSGTEPSSYGKTFAGL